MRFSVLLVGSYPPPFGGCSVHVMRLLELLDAKFNVDVIDLYGDALANEDPRIVRCGRAKPRNLIRAIIALSQRPAQLVHFHVAAMEAFLYAAYAMLAVVRPGTRTIITIHSGSFVGRFRHGPSWRRTLLRNVLGRFDKIITVNNEQRTFLSQVGIDTKRISVIPAFLPPFARGSERAQRALDVVAGCSRIVLSSGYGLPYYGFQYIVEALESLRVAGDRSGVILCMYNSYDEAYVEELERSLTNGLIGVIMRDLNPDEFAWLLERCDLYIRATDRDGDAVAIREAQFYGKSVIASDCVERPPNVRLFKTNDSHSLIERLNTPDHKEAVPTRGDGSAEFSAILDVYHEALTA